MRALCICLGLMLVVAAGAEEKKAEETLEVKAKLVEIPSQFPPDDLYDYAYVMKYEVVGGKLDKQTLLVAHYKPKAKRSEIKDKMKASVSGTLKRFKQGDLHQLTLRTAMEKIWKGAVVDDFLATDKKTPRYWCLKVDPAS